jgi:hypothetical protein
VATAASLISAGAAWRHHPAASWASGGATAGGVYLLSAKQRYNERVKAGTKGFAALRPLLESGNVDGIRSYFASEEVGSWKDLSTAGYLLANAFRTNSSAAPDSLPSVKVRVCAIMQALPLVCLGLVLGTCAWIHSHPETLVVLLDVRLVGCCRSGRRSREMSRP